MYHKYPDSDHNSNLYWKGLDLLECLEQIVLHEFVNILFASQVLLELSTNVSALKGHNVRLCNKRFTAGYIFVIERNLAQSQAFNTIKDNIT